MNGVTESTVGTFMIFNLATGQPFYGDFDPAVYYNAVDCLRSARLLNARFPRNLPWRCYRIG